MADRQSWHSTIERSPNHKRSSVPSGNAIKRPNVLNTPILNFLTNWLKQDKDFRLSEPNIQSWHDPAPERPQAIADQIPSGQDLNEQELQDAVGIINDSREVSPLIPKLRLTAHDTSQPQPPTNKQPEYSPPLPSGRQFPPANKPDGGEISLGLGEGGIRYNPIPEIDALRGRNAARATKAIRDSQAEQRERETPEEFNARWAHQNAMSQLNQSGATAQQGLDAIQGSPGFRAGQRGDDITGAVEQGRKMKADEIADPGRYLRNRERRIESPIGEGNIDPATGREVAWEHRNDDWSPHKEGVQKYFRGSKRTPEEIDAYWAKQEAEGFGARERQEASRLRTEGVEQRRAQHAQEIEDRRWSPRRPDPNQHVYVRNNVTSDELFGEDDRTGVRPGHVFERAYNDVAEENPDDYMEITNAQVEKLNRLEGSAKDDYYAHLRKKDRRSKKRRADAPADRVQRRANTLRRGVLKHGYDAAAARSKLLDMGEPGANYLATQEGKATFGGDDDTSASPLARTLDQQGGYTSRPRALKDVNRILNDEAEVAEDGGAMGFYHMLDSDTEGFAGTDWLANTHFANPEATGEALWAKASNPQWGHWFFNRGEEPGTASDKDLVKLFDRIALAHEYGRTEDTQSPGDLDSMLPQTGKDPITEKEKIEFMNKHFRKDEYANSDPPPPPASTAGQWLGRGQR